MTWSMRWSIWVRAWASQSGSDSSESTASERRAIRFLDRGLSRSEDGVLLPRAAALLDVPEATLRTRLDNWVSCFANRSDGRPTAPPG